MTGNGSAITHPPLTPGHWPQALGPGGLAQPGSGGRQISRNAIASGSNRGLAPSLLLRCGAFCGRPFGVCGTRQQGHDAQRSETLDPLPDDGDHGRCRCRNDWTRPAGNSDWGSDPRPTRVRGAVCTTPRPPVPPLGAISEPDDSRRWTSSRGAGSGGVRRTTPAVIPETHSTVVATGATAVMAPHSPANR